MATYTGVDGVVKIKPEGSGSSTAIAVVRGWSIDESGETIDCTLLGSTSKLYKAGTKSWTATADCYWSAEDTTGQDIATAAAAVELVFYPEGETSTDITYSGDAIVDSVSRSTSVDSMIEVSLSFTGTGALAKGAV